MLKDQLWVVFIWSEWPWSHLCWKDGREKARENKLGDIQTLAPTDYLEISRQGLEDNDQRTICGHDQELELFFKMGMKAQRTSIFQCVPFLEPFASLVMSLYTYDKNRNIPHGTEKTIYTQCATIYVIFRYKQKGFFF